MGSFANSCFGQLAPTFRALASCWFVFVITRVQFLCRLIRLSCWASESCLCVEYIRVVCHLARFWSQGNLHVGRETTAFLPKTVAGLWTTVVRQRKTHICKGSTASRHRAIECGMILSTWLPAIEPCPERGPSRTYFKPKTRGSCPSRIRCLPMNG